MSEVRVIGFRGTRLGKDEQQASEVLNGPG